MLTAEINGETIASHDDMWKRSNRHTCMRNTSAAGRGTAPGASSVTGLSSLSSGALPGQAPLAGPP